MIQHAVPGGSRETARPFLLPAVSLLLLFTLFPFAFTVVLTLSRVSLVGGLQLQFAGSANWVRLVTDARFWSSVRNTVIIVLASVSLEFVLGLALALLLYAPLRAGGLFRVLYIVPMTLTPIAVGYMWRMIYDESIGPLNALLRHVGLGPVGWVSGTHMPLASIIITNVWHWTPFLFVLLLAGLRGIPTEVVEAAQIDGASGMQTFRYVLMPMLTPTALAAVLLRSLEAFKIVDEIFIITGGGPGTRTESLTLQAYYVGLLSFDLAYGATVAMGLFLLVVAAAMVFLSLTRRIREAGERP